MSIWLFFGCGPRENGHYLLTQSGEKLFAYGSHPNAWLRSMCWDGNLAPQPEPAPESLIYRAAFSRLGGWGYSALSWWDRSADKRGKSNSTILAPSLTIEPEAMLAEAQQRFPWAFSRLP
jgi:hypothetical protein